VRRSIITGAAIAVMFVGGTVAAYPYLSSGSRPPVALPAPAVPVTTQTVKSGDVPIYLSGIGTVEAYNTVIVRTQIQGQITQIGFTEGQAVKAGDLLAQIDPRPYQAQLDQALANRARDEAQLANAQANLQRYLPLLAKQFATPQLVDTQKAQVAQLQATVQSDEAVIENARVLLDYTRITAPIRGVTGIRQIDVGNIAHPTDPQGIVVVTQLQPISVIFTLPESTLPQIQAAMATGSLTVLAMSQDGRTTLDTGKLDVLDNQIIQTSGSVRLKAEFPNPKRRLWPGELVDVRLLIETRHDALTVAAPAVQQGPQGAYVYVVTADNRVEPRAVTVAQIGAGRAIIASGLSAGDRVVVDGQSRLEPGSKVTVLQGQAAQQLAAENAQSPEIP
jgi:membrane fusion protein, multidrug efflux system